MRHDAACTSVNKLNTGSESPAIDKDYLRFPVYALTGCSLILAIVESIVLRMKAEQASTLQSIASGRVKRSPKLKSRRQGCECDKFRRKALKAVRTTEQDSRELLQITPVSAISSRGRMELICLGLVHIRMRGKRAKHG